MILGVDEDYIANEFPYQVGLFALWLKGSGKTGEDWAEKFQYGCKRVADWFEGIPRWWSRLDIDYTPSLEDPALGQLIDTIERSGQEAPSKPVIGPFGTADSELYHLGLGQVINKNRIEQQVPAVEFPSFDHRMRLLSEHEIRDFMSPKISLVEKVSDEDVELETELKKDLKEAGYEPNKMSDVDFLGSMGWEWPKFSLFDGFLNLIDKINERVYEKSMMGFFRDKRGPKNYFEPFPLQ